MAEPYESRWEASFEAQAREGACNSVPPEVLVRNVSYYLRSRDVPPGTRWLDLGCGAGQTTLWLGRKGLDATGIDIAPSALALARNALASYTVLDRTLPDRVHFYEGSIVKIPFPDGYFQGIIEANVIQHLSQDDRASVFAEICRLLVPGGLFCGYLMGQASTAFVEGRTWPNEKGPEPGSLLLKGSSSPYHLGSVGLAHFFSKAELRDAFDKFAHVDVLPMIYRLPQEEAERRGYHLYELQFWNVFAVR